MNNPNQPDWSKRRRLIYVVVLGLFGLSAWSLHLGQEVAFTACVGGIVTVVGTYIGGSTVQDIKMGGGHHGVQVQSEI